jgi:hypothetical protein
MTVSRQPDSPATLEPRLARSGCLARRGQGIAPTIVGGSKKHGGPDLGPIRALQAWKELGVDGLGLANQAPGPEFPHDQMPKLTTRMVARIQGFPDSWAFAGRKTAAYRQVGNAFPPGQARPCGLCLNEPVRPDRGKYGPLRDYLVGRQGDEPRMSFAQIEELVGRLPESQRGCTARGGPTAPISRHGHGGTPGGADCPFGTGYTSWTSRFYAHPTSPLCVPSLIRVSIRAGRAGSLHILVMSVFAGRRRRCR